MSKLGPEIPILGWRCVQSEIGGYYVFVDPRYETIKLYKGMDDRLIRLDHTQGPNSVSDDFDQEVIRQIEMFPER